MATFLEQLRAKKEKLTPTETVVQPHPCICTGTESFGMDALGGQIEKEHAEAEEVTRQKARLCAAALREADYAVAYTGAGISTSVGISDYRGPKGVWTCLAKGVIPDEKFDITSAGPSYSHMALRKLKEEGLIKFITSTNLDGLHYKSGFTPLKNLAELHGCMWYERCTRCGTDSAVRPFPVRRGGDPAKSHPRSTGRWCDCGGMYMDSGIDFGQSLPLRHLALAEAAARESDFSLVVGTSLRVAPASTLPFVLGASEEDDAEPGEGKSNAMIVNLMETPMDAKARLRSFSKSDTFFWHLMQELELEVAPPPVCSHLKSANQMKALARRYLPDHGRHYVGEEQREREMASALFQVEAEMLSSSAQPAT